MIVGVYIHARPNGEAFYVGKGRRSRAYCLKPRNPHHANIVKKYGKENIIVDFAPCESEAAAFALEIEWIKILRLFGAKLTNMTDGGEGGSPCEEVKERLRAAAKGNKNMLGHIHSIETRNRMSIAAKGKFVSEDTRRKISAAMTGRKKSEEHKANISVAKLGLAFSEEHKANIKAASIKRILTPEAKANMLAGSMSCKGKNLTEEHKAKISAAHRARRTK